MIKRNLFKEQTDKEPYLIWNAFIDLIAIDDESKLTVTQRIAQQIFRYDSEIQNGGHLQYFENNRKSDYKEIIDSLKKVGANKQADILAEASNLFLGKKRKPIKTVFKFVERAKLGEYDKYDSMYYDAEPNINYYLEEYLRNNLAEFINFI